MESSSPVSSLSTVLLKSIVPPPSSVTKSAEICINRDEFKIGRSLEADHPIPYVSISRNHCTLRRDAEGSWFIKDTSTFGIKINNRPIEKHKELALNNEDIVQLDLAGDFKYKFLCERTNKKRKHDSDAEDSDTSQKKKCVEQSDNSNTADYNEEYVNLLKNTNELYKNTLKTEAEKYEQKLKEIAEEKEKKLEELKKELEENFKSQLEEFKQQIQNAATVEKQSSEEEKKHENAFAVSLDSQMSFTVTESGSHGGPSSFGNILESELQCPICSELFISAVSLNCSHTFCEYCIVSWRKKKNMCPVCRQKITLQSVNLIVNTIIEGLVGKMDDKSKANRKKCIDQRIKSKEIPIIDLTSVSVSSTNMTTRRRSSRRGRR